MLTLQVLEFIECSSRSLIKRLQMHKSTTTTTTVLQPFFPRPHGWAGARTELQDFMVQEEINRGRHTDHPPWHHSIWTNQSPPPPSPIFFYGPDALPAVQPTVSKHWRQLAHSDYGEDARVLLNGVTCTVSIPYRCPNHLNKTFRGCKLLNKRLNENGDSDNGKRCLVIQTHI